MQPLTNEYWFKKSHRRCLVDMHIPDWDERFLSEFDSERYVELMKQAQVDAVYFYTNSCVGLTNFPTKTDKMHKGLKGRDIVREITTLTKEAGMHSIVYYNIWSKWAYDHHPEWRAVNSQGLTTGDYYWGQPGRYGVCCYNHAGFRDMVLEDIERLCTNYEFDGLWIDMIMLSQVCYCSACRKRYLEESGSSEIPRTVDWHNPEFIRFQRLRQSWQSGFAELVTQSAKKWKPGISLGHNVAGYFVGWHNGSSLHYFDQNDYLSGDISGGPQTVNYVCKMFHSTSKHRSVEFMTTVADANLLEHTVYKPKHYLKNLVYLAMANNGAFSFIDAIDPRGTMNENIYRMMGEIYGETRQYEPYMDFNAEFCLDVAIYTNIESLIDLRDNGKKVEDVPPAITPHHTAAMNAARAMIDANLPFGVISKNRLDELGRYQVVILPDLQMMDEEEVEAIRQFVQAGGSVYASAHSSLVDKTGKRRDNFMLGDVLGVSYERTTWEDIAYYAPTAAGKPLFEAFDDRYPMTVNCNQLIVRENEGTETLATIVLPDLDPNNPHQFSSAISSPPEIPTTHPGVTVNRYGRGRAMYAAGELERMAKPGQRAIFINLIRSLLTRAPSFQTNAPKPVEVTMLRHPSGNRYTVNVINFQQEQPNIPVSGVRIKALIGGKKPIRVLLLPAEQPVAFEVEDEYVAFDVPQLDAFHMFAIDCE